MFSGVERWVHLPFIIIIILTLKAGSAPVSDIAI